MFYPSSYISVNAESPPHEKRENYAGQMFFYRRRVKIPSTERVNNEEVIKKMATERIVILKMYPLTDYEEGGLEKLNPQGTY